MEIIFEKKYWILAATMVLFIILFYPKANNDSKLPIQIKGVTVHAEVADSSKEKIRGLMFRKKLPQNDGMLFPYSHEEIHTFWMKNTLIPLDIVWINSQKEVVHIEHSAPPCKRSPCPSYTSPHKARYILELNGGWSIQHNLNPGDQIFFSY